MFSSSFTARSFALLLQIFCKEVRSIEYGLHDNYQTIQRNEKDDYDDRNGRIISNNSSCSRYFWFLRDCIRSSRYCKSTLLHLLDLVRYFPSFRTCEKTLSRDRKESYVNRGEFRFSLHVK